MSAYFCLCSAAARWRSLLLQYRLPLLLAAIALTIQGCAPPQQLGRNAAASDPAAPAAAVGYRSAFGSYQSRRPVEPMPWRERNEQVAPKPKADGQ